MSYNSNPEFDMKLIENVKARPPIYDGRLPSSERSRGIRDRLWNEIYLEFAGEHKLEKIRQRWKNLRDMYSRVKGGKHSTAWRHWKQMEEFLGPAIGQTIEYQQQPQLKTKPIEVFLNNTHTATDDIIQYEEVIEEDEDYFGDNTELVDDEGNVIKNELPMDADDADDYDSMLNNGLNTSIKEQPIEKHEIDGDDGDNGDGDCEIIESSTVRTRSATTKVSPNRQKTKTKVVNSLAKVDVTDFDEVDHYCAALACSLRELDVKDRLELQISFMQQIYDKVYK